LIKKLYRRADTPLKLDMTLNLPRKLALIYYWSINLLLFSPAGGLFFNLGFHSEWHSRVLIQRGSNHEKGERRLVGNPWANSQAEKNSCDRPGDY